MSSLYLWWSWFLTRLGDIGCAFAPPLVRAKDIRACLAIIQPGDVICRKYIYYLDSYLIPGTYSHSGLYCGNDTVIHSVAEGAEEIDVIDYIKDADGFIVLRPRYFTENASSKAVNLANSLIGKPYDFLFDASNQDAFYCHELTVAALKAAGIDITDQLAVYVATDLICRCNTLLEV